MVLDSFGGCDDGGLGLDFEGEAEDANRVVAGELTVNL